VSGNARKSSSVERGRRHKLGTVARAHWTEGTVSQSQPEAEPPEPAQFFFEPSRAEGHTDVLAKHRLKRLAAIAKRVPRGKPPLLAEIETPLVCFFRPHTHTRTSEAEVSTGYCIPPISIRWPLDAVLCLQDRMYPKQKVLIVLPFLADGVLALDGSKAEGTFFFGCRAIRML